MRIICFGDSNTYGYDPRGYFGDRYDAPDRWLDLISKNTGFECINAGINGREIPRFSFPEQLLNQLTASDLFLVMLGTNDLLQGASAKETATRMALFLKQLLSRHKNILLVAPPPLKRGVWVPSDNLVAESANLANAYSAVAAALNVAFIDTQNWNIELAFDGVHFTEEGHRNFAKHLAEYIQ